MIVIRIQGKCAANDDTDLEEHISAVLDHDDIVSRADTSLFLSPHVRG